MSQSLLAIPNPSVAKGHFGAAYVHAVAAGAGLGVQLAGPAHDATGIDLTVIARPGGSARRSHELHLQVKCTSQADVGASDVTIDLPLKNYNELREPFVQVPLLLVVVLVPEDPNEWLTQTHQALIARRCAYWANLVGAEPKQNSSTVRVSIPRSQMLSSTALRDIMMRIVNGGTP